MTAELVYLVLTYLVAAVPFGLVVTTLRGGDADLRAAGSGNIGATNVARVYGWKVAGPVLGLDVLKGFVPVLIARLAWPEAPLVWPGLVGLVAFLAHCWSVYLDFRGGKGVATGGGALLALAPLPTLLAVVTWGALLAVSGRSSVAALGATAGMILFAAWLDPRILIFVLLLAFGVFWRHLANIRRLVRGEEEEVIRPVRWGRERAGGPSAEDVLAQGPAGGRDGPALWRDEEPDPIDQPAPGEADPHLRRS